MNSNKDPVCGMNIDPKKSSHKTEFQNKQYNFCCQGCLDKFKKNPKQFIKSE